jgi:hypothetical protein
MDENFDTKLCTRCKTVKPVTEFPKINKTKDKLKNYCRDCERERLKIYYKKNKAKIDEKHNEYYRNNKGKIQLVKKIRNQENKEKVNKYNREYHREWFKKYPEKIKEYNDTAYMRKLEILLRKQEEEEIQKMEGKTE